MRILWTAFALLLLTVAPRSGATDRRRVEVAGLSFEVPTTWKQSPIKETNTPVVFTVPRAEGDTSDVQLALIHYGPAQAKFVKENLAGWTKLFADPDGGPATDLVKTTNRKIGPLTATVIDLTATYTGGRTDPTPFPGAGPKRNWRLLGAALEGGPPAPWFWRIIGPARTVTAAKPDFDALIDSARPAAVK
jgi:hypothetical protein